MKKTVGFLFALGLSLVGLSLVGLSPSEAGTLPRAALLEQASAEQDESFG